MPQSSPLTSPEAHVRFPPVMVGAVGLNTDMKAMYTAVSDQERCYRAVLGKDRRFDGVFYTGVRTTGIYCRPSCPAVTPRRKNVVFYPTAAAAQGAGFRACVASAQT